mgnify:CR=1 FL=1
MDYKNEIGHLLQKYFSGTIMPDEQRLLDSWMKEKEEHKQLFDRLRKDTRFAEEYGIFREVDTTRAWETFRVKNGLRRQRRMTTWIKYAAVIALPLLIAGVWLLFPRGGERSIPVAQNTKIVKREESPVLEVVGGGKVILEKEKDKMIEAGRGVDVQQSSGMLVYSDSVVSEYVDTNVLRIPKGGEFKLQLADGTRVYLNSATDLRYPVAFTGPERRVYLKGEAYFDVTKSKEWPFIVRTCRSSVKVLGTSFNVCSYEEDSLEQVTLEQGGVEVKHHDETYLLHPGEQFELDTTNEEIEVKPVNVKLYTSWIDGMFRFHNMPLDLLTVKLERWYDVHFVFSNEDCKNYRFTGAIRKDVDFNEFIRLIERTTNVKFIINQKDIIIQEK